MIDWVIMPKPFTFGYVSEISSSDERLLWPRYLKTHEDIFTCYLHVVNLLSSQKSMLPPRHCTDQVPLINTQDRWLLQKITGNLDSTWEFCHEFCCAYCDCHDMSFAVNRERHRKISKIFILWKTKSYARTRLSWRAHTCVENARAKMNYVKP